MLLVLFVQRSFLTAYISIHLVSATARNFNLDASVCFNTFPSLYYIVEFKHAKQPGPNDQI